MKKALLITASIFLSNFLYAQLETAYLESVVDHINQIKSASYDSEITASAPYDTLAFRTFSKFVNVFANPFDTLIGAKFLVSDIDDNTKYEYCYDGQYSVRLNWENREAQIDTLIKSPNSRPLSPFFWNVKSIIEYAIQNEDSSKVSYVEYQDSTRISFHFPDKQVELLRLVPSVKSTPGITSRYVILINTKTNLPFKCIRKMPHQTTWEICTNLEIDNKTVWELNALRQIPYDFSIKGREQRMITKSELEGKPAPNWKLKDVEGDSVSLKDLKSKVLLIQFTGVGCGPCHASLPFLKKLREDNMDKDFELISIETWSKNISGLIRYKQKNAFNFKFFMVNEKVKEQYKVNGVPAFFILDEQRIIQKVIMGYRKGITDQDIMKAINELI